MPSRPSEYNDAAVLPAVMALMAERNVGAAVVLDPESSGPGILTERDLLTSVAAGQDPDHELVGEHLTEDAILASPDWSLEQAAECMIQRGFRHLLVVRGSDLEGILSMRDIVRCWAPGRVPA